jgi:uncharacterized cupin superfamily protein
MGHVNERDLEWTETDRGETRFRRKKLANAAGLDDLGASLYELPPDASSWPYHFHTANAEAVYVLDGTGLLRTPDGEERVESGDFCAFPATPEGAHRLHNDGEEPLRFLAVSTMRDPDVTVYPDSEKIGVYAGSPPGGEKDERVVSGYYRRDDDVEYWEGEES